MATREENLKKINDELEMLSDEELDQVTGGSAGESADDSRFLNSLGGFCNRYGTFRMQSQDHDYEIRDAWKQVGVDAEIHTGYLFTGGCNNVYKINGKKVSRVEAINHAMKVTGHHMEWNSWGW